MDGLFFFLVCIMLIHKNVCKSPVVIIQEYLALERDFVLSFTEMKENLKEVDVRGRQLKFVLL